MRKRQAFYLYLDDIREMDSMYNQFNYYEHCRSVDEAKSYVESAIHLGVYEIWFDLDHDLGDFASYGGDGIELVNWLVEEFYDKGVIFKFHFHSMNPVGVQNMRNAIEKYWEEF